MRCAPRCFIAGERGTLEATSERIIREVAAEERAVDTERIARGAEHVATAGDGGAAAALCESSTGTQPWRTACTSVRRM